MIHGNDFEPQSYKEKKITDKSVIKLLTISQYTNISLYTRSETDGLISRKNLKRKRRQNEASRKKIAK